VRHIKNLAGHPISRVTITEKLSSSVKAFFVTTVLLSAPLPSEAADVNVARLAEYVSIHLETINADAVKPSFEKCQQTVANKISRARTSIEQQIANAESRSRANELQQTLKGFENEVYQARLSCLGVATVLLQEVFEIEDRPADDVSYLKRKLSDITPAGWRSFSQIFQLEPAQAYRAAASRFSGSFAAQVGGAANNLGKSLGISEADMARQSKTDLSAMSDQMTVIGASRLEKRALDRITSLGPLLLQFLIIDRAVRIDPTTPNKIKLPEPTKSEFIRWSQEAVKALNCSIPNDDINATNLGLGDIVCR